MSSTTILHNEGDINKVETTDSEAPQASHDQKHGQVMGRDSHDSDPLAHDVEARESEKLKSTDQEQLEGGMESASHVGNAKFNASLEEAEGKTVI